MGSKLSTQEKVARALERTGLVLSRNLGVPTCEIQTRESGNEYTLYQKLLDADGTLVLLKFKILYKRNHLGNRQVVHDLVVVDETANLGDKLARFLIRHNVPWTLAHRQRYKLGETTEPVFACEMDVCDGVAPRYACNMFVKMHE